jgi:ketosteroid isomerase-like protein
MTFIRKAPPYDILETCPLAHSQRGSEVKPAYLRAMFMAAFAALLSLNASADTATDRSRIERIFAAHDRLQAGLDEYMASVADDVILMPNGGASIEGKAAYLQHVKDFYASGTIQIRHELIAVHSYPEVVIATGRAVGTYTPPGGGAANAFETRNLFVFRRLENGNLAVWQIIFNAAPPSSRS